MNDVHMIEDDSQELQIQVTSSTNTSTLTSSSQPRRKKKEFFVKTSYLLMNTHRGYKKQIMIQKKARSKACLKTFSIHCDGKSAVDKHMNSNTHKKSMKSFQKSCSLTQFMTPERESDKISAVECILVIHEVKHGRSYRSQDCTVNLVRTVFESSLAKSKV